MTQPFLTQPYLLSTRPDSEMNIVWLQLTRTDARVEYGSTSALGRSVGAASEAVTGLRAPASSLGYAKNPEDNPPLCVYRYTAVIRALTPGERVYYRCVADGRATDIYDFRAAPTPGEPYRFALLSDLQGAAECDETVRRAGRFNPDFLIYAGDAATYSWRADLWFDLGAPYQDEHARRRAFFPCVQQRGARLAQYCPLFICPGNHEMDDLRVGMDKDFAWRDENWTYSIFTQLFRPLYPDTDASLTGRRWYSADYGDMHIVSLSVQRWAQWDAYEAPGWRLVDSIAPDSPQISWLKADLKDSDARFKWVFQHWHLLNKGTDVQNALCPPHINAEGAVSYPVDYGRDVLMRAFEEGGVNAVNYGHSHVYERYFTRGTHYIEAAYMGVCYREANAPLHPSGLTPIVENNSKPSFVIVERKSGGLYATGRFARGECEVFDAYQIADERGRSTPPPAN